MLAASAVLLVSCDRPPAPSAAASTSPPAHPIDTGLNAERDRLEAEIARLRAEEQEAAYRLLEQQKAALASERDAIERDRAELDRARLALTEAAAASSDAPQESAAATTPAGRKPVAAVSSPRPASLAADGDYQMFYESLAPHGRWLESDDYGWVWQPGLAREAAWRPYTLGRWVDSDQGWAWVSDEPFGWATYHYGRWALLDAHGWIWVPGDTWAPAWVAWRRNDECVGWAPLPPETLYAEEVTFGPEIETSCGLTEAWFTFVPVRHFDEPVIGHCWPVVENHRFFGVTLSITNVVIRRDRVVCGGPEPRWINSCLSRPMKRHSIQHRRDWRESRDYRPHLEDERLSCYSPRLKAGWNEALRPARRDGRLEKVRVVRNTESPQAEVQTEFRGERERRRQQAVEALKVEPVRVLAERHAELERLKARRVVMEQKATEARSTGFIKNGGQLEKPALTTGVAPQVPEKELANRESAINRRDGKGTARPESAGAFVQPPSPQPPAGPEADKPLVQSSDTPRPRPGEPVTDLKPQSPNPSNDAPSETVRPSNARALAQEIRRRRETQATLEPTVPEPTAPGSVRPKLPVAPGPAQKGTAARPVEPQTPPAPDKVPREPKDRIEIKTPAVPENTRREAEAKTQADAKVREEQNQQARDEDDSQREAAKREETRRVQEQKQAELKRAEVERRRATEEQARDQRERAEEARRQREAQDQAEAARRDAEAREQAETKQREEAQKRAEITRREAEAKSREEQNRRAHEQEAAKREETKREETKRDEARRVQEREQTERRREEIERRRAAEERERVQESRRQREAQERAENTRRDAEARERAENNRREAEAKERAEQNRRAREQEESKREETRREEARREESKREESRRGQEREQSERRRATEERERAEESRRQRESQERAENGRREAEARERAEQNRRAQEREESDRRRAAEERSRAEKADEERRRNKN